jgi:hypothetical protein
MTQDDADALLAMPKRFDGMMMLSLPVGSDQRFDLLGVPHPEERFVMDLWRGRRNALKLKFQTRGRKVVILARLDINGAPHTNPDGEVVGGTHLHLFREGFGDKWAAPIDPAAFRDVDDHGLIFDDFCKLCAVINAPPMQVGFL